MTPRDNDTDETPTHDRRERKTDEWGRALFTFLLGTLVGVLGTFATYSGRLATIETQITTIGAAQADLKADFKELRADRRLPPSERK